MERGTRLAWLALAVVATACGGAGDPPPSSLRVVSARSYAEADRLFRGDARWLGGDGALSIPLDDERTLWLFGDSFVATSDASDRRESAFVRNTLAIQTGRDPRTASMRFVWRTGTDGAPGPFFPDRDERWYWPGHGVRLEEGPLLVFLMGVRATPGEGLGFEEAGYRIARVDDPDADPLTWEPVWIAPPELPADPDASVGTAVVRDGDHLVALVNAEGSRHLGRLARFPIDALLDGRAEPEWWTADGWTAAAALGASEPLTVISDAGAEASLHRDPSGTWVHVLTRGFGGTTIALATAPSVTGPWSSPADVFTPPESTGPAPFVYAAKAHPWLAADGGLLVTYATNSFDFADLFTEEGQDRLYYPRFVRLELER
ncbi:MAG: DUF5005 domain-containing protein [Sandaracinaceae bacterium]|nr:DUF5005 domain-containing protein [Sandaracinaceae bacterium]